MSKCEIQPLPASLQTQLAMYDSTIEDAKTKLATAQTERYEMLDAFHGLKGRKLAITHYNGERVTFFVSAINYNRDGSIFRVSGEIVKKDGSLSRNHACAYGSDISAGDVEIVDDAGAQ